MSIKKLILKFFNKILNGIGKLLRNQNWLINIIWNNMDKSKFMDRISNDRQMIKGVISKCDFGYKDYIKITGWALPRVNYDKIEIYIDENYLGDANLNLIRMDVYNNYPNFAERNSGWEFQFKRDSNIESGNKIKVIFKKRDNIIEDLEVDFKYSLPYEESIKEISDICKQENMPKILVLGLTNRIKFNCELSQMLPNHKILFGIEGMQYDMDSVYNYCRNIENINEKDLEKIKMFMLPSIFQRNQMLGNFEIEIDEEIENLLNKKSYLREAYTNQFEKYRLKGMTESYSKYYVYNSYQYINNILDIVNPEMVLIWNEFYPLHHMLGNICKERNVKVVYYEGGVLPGTYAIESDGQMGESFPAREYKKFKNYDISKEEIHIASRVWDYLYESKINTRYASASKQHKYDVIKQLKSGRPTIFYAGQNDFESGIYPYTKNTEQYHSPSFKSSYDAMLFLAELSRKNDWNFIYKRHPMMRPFEDTKYYPENVISNDFIDIQDAIDISDLTITILSQSSYVALIRCKPVLMLGYNQLRGKGCTYEAYNLNDIEKTINEALESGFTAEQKMEFIKHIAQLNKYYLFDDFLINKSFVYSKDKNECGKYFNKILNNEI